MEEKKHYQASVHWRFYVPVPRGICSSFLHVRRSWSPNHPTQGCRWHSDTKRVAAKSHRRLAGLYWPWLKV